MQKTMLLTFVFAVACALGSAGFVQTRSTFVRDTGHIAAENSCTVSADAPGPSDFPQQIHGGDTLRESAFLPENRALDGADLRGAANQKSLAIVAVFPNGRFARLRGTLRKNWSAQAEPSLQSLFCTWLI